MRRILPWIALAGVIATAGAGALAVLQATLLGPAGFARGYLEALARGDARSALTLPGVGVDPDAPFVADDVLAGLSGIRLVEERDGADGVRLVTYAWESPQGDGVTTFAVEQVGVRLGLFPVWGFAAPPTATIELSVQHDPRYTLNGLAFDTGLDSGDPVDRIVLVPGAYVFGHESAYLEADPVVVLADTPGERISVTVDVQPGPRLLEQVTREITDHLDECAAQQVLFPTGCPFGRHIANRVVSEPRWSIVNHPEIEVVAADEFARWLVPATTGVAHLTVDVQSLFDGTVSTFDEDVDFEVEYLVEIIDDDTLWITGR